ncbi:MAG: response regulator [Armatimonadetes bacterium]|nr:response regulator [Armatimonadota bacterium]
MVVDDDPTMLTLMHRVLEDAGFEATTVNGGRAALKELCRATLNGGLYDAILLDIAMPDINGWRVLDAVKSNPLWADMRVIVVSGFVQSPQALMRVARYDGVFVEKSADFDRTVVNVLGRLTAEPVAQS